MWRRTWKNLMHFAKALIDPIVFMYYFAVYCSQVTMTAGHAWTGHPQLKS